MLAVGLALSIVLASSVADVLLGLLATLAGYLGGLLALQVGLLAGALGLGVGVRSIVIGVGPRLADRSTPRRALVVRAVPLFLSVSIAPGRAPVRPRMWGAALASAVLGIAATALLAWVWVVLGVACGLTVAHALVPRKTAGATSTGWLLLRLLRLTGDQAARLDAAPAVTATVDATVEGDLDDADRLAARLAADHPTLRTAKAARILVHQAHARYAEAMAIALAMIDEPDQTPAEAAAFFAALAGLACDIVEAGGLPPEIGLSTAASALEMAEALGYPAHKLTGAKALHALLTGDPAQALPLARQAVEANDDRIGRADDLATLARAHMAAGDNKAARAALGEAEKTVPWWPRVAATRARLDIT